MSNSLWPHWLQHARFPCSSPSPEDYSNSCPLNWWCHPTISSSVTLFSSYLQSFLVSGSFPMSWLFASHQVASILEFQHQSFQWIFRVDLESPRDSQESSPTFCKWEMRNSVVKILNTTLWMVELGFEQYLPIYKPHIFKSAMCFLESLQ